MLDAEGKTINIGDNIIVASAPNGKTSIHRGVVTGTTLTYVKYDHEYTYYDGELNVNVTRIVNNRSFPRNVIVV